VARQRDRQLIRAHAGAVVAYANKANAAVLNIDVDALRAGIETIFNKFLDDRSGTLDHFAGGNLIDEFVR
jgi:hypothetical protein